jgi:hypothetical protein
MAGPTLRLNVRISGANEVLRALQGLPKDADRELQAEAFDISKSLADRIKAAGRADTRQSARAARSVREVKAGAWPAITAGGTKGSRPFLFGSEFGMTRKSGWYRKRRYFDSAGSQFRPHLGSGSYWFFKTAEREQPWIASEWHKAADAVVRKWSA